jgi:hypothetical protein
MVSFLFATADKKVVHSEGNYRKQPSHRHNTRKIPVIFDKSGGRPKDSSLGRLNWKKVVYRVQDSMTTVFLS